MRVLGIETSCDETAVAVYDSKLGLLAHQLYSQVERHRQYGGVVPELASRDHIQKITLLLKAALAESNSQKQAIDAVAYTAGPGLIGALLVGSAFARSLAWGWQKPSIAVNHIESHVLAPLLESEAPEFPFLALLVSGGHTQLVAVNAVGDYQLLSETLDDAAGEAFDKTAKVLGLPYPGGPVLAQLATEGNAGRYKFTRPMVNRPGLDFSFSGLKTQVATTWKNSDQAEQTKKDIAASFQQAIVDTFVIKCRRALAQTNMSTLVIAGGVGANIQLRTSLMALTQSLGVKLYYPRTEFCTDNAAMVALTGCLKLKNGFKRDESLAIEVKPRWPFTKV